MPVLRYFVLLLVVMHSVLIATFGLAMSIFEGMHWGAFPSAGALGRWKLIEVG